MGKRKTGAKRVKGSGRLSRAKRYDHGTDQAQAKSSLYGTNGSDAIGRAFSVGLLGEDGQARMSSARSIAAAYWPMFGTGRIGCTLGDRSGGGGGEGSLGREQWLSDTLDRIGALGHDVRTAFDELCIDIHPDSGPAWLDRLIEAKGDKAKAFDIRDLGQLKRALAGLDAIVC